MVKVAALQKLAKRKLLLFVLVLKHHQLLLQDLVLEIGLIPQLGCGLFKFSVHFSFFLLNRLIMAVELFALLLDNLDLLFDVLVVALGVAQGHLVLIQSADLVFKVLLHRLGFCKLRIQQLEIFLKNSHMNSVSFCVGLDLFPLLFVSLDKLQVFSCDVIVILLHLTECSFVVLHQLVDVLVFALFNLMDLNLLAQFEFGLQIFDLLFILLDVGRFFDFEGLGQALKVRLHFPLLLLDTCDVGDVVGVVLFFLRIFGVHVAGFLLIVVCFFLHHDCHRVVLDCGAALEVFVLKMLDLLHMRGDVGSVTVFAVLHVSVEVADLSVKLFNLFPSVVVKVVDHVLLDLQHVTLDLGVL